MGFETASFLGGGGAGQKIGIQGGGVKPSAGLVE